MTTSNHVLAGALIAATVQEPVLVVPLAFLSHFLLDALPHYGLAGEGYSEALKHKTTYVTEALGAIGLMLLLASGVFGWNIFLLAAVVAVAPDLEWMQRYFLFERKGLEPPKTVLTDIHQKIQWCERKWGIAFEIAFFAIGYIVLLDIVR